MSVHTRLPGPVRGHRVRHKTAAAASVAVWSIVAAGCTVSGWNRTAAQTLEEHGPLTLAAVVFNLSLATAGIIGVWGCQPDIATADSRGESAPASVARLPGALGFGTAPDYSPA